MKGGRRPNSGRKPGFGHPELRRSRNPLYGVYHAMISRCEYSKNKSYSDYGARGIRVCEEWRKDYLKFLSWANENGYKHGPTIERKNTDGNYEPDNCKWATWEENQNNRRNNKKVVAFGEAKTIYEWVKDPRCVVTKKTLKSRLRRFKPPEWAMTSPIQALAEGIA